MVLNDDEIALACQGGNPLIQNRVEKGISNCTYTFHVGAIFEAQTGGELQFGQQAGSAIRNRIKSLQPNETCLVVTAEQVHMPDNLLMTYTPLNSLAQRGLMMLNASVVEPGYSGPLSCVLVNLSSSNVDLAPGDRISKAVFQRLAAPPVKLQPQLMKPDEYAQQIARVARLYNQSFLDVGNILEKAKATASEAAMESTRKTATIGGVIIFLLVAFAQFEPLVTKWLREKTGLVTESTMMGIQAEAAKKMIEAQTNQLVSQSKLLEVQAKVVELEAKVRALQTSDPQKSKAP